MLLWKGSIQTALSSCVLTPVCYTCVRMTPDQFKELVATLSTIVDARAKTTETLIRGEIASVKHELREEIKASEERTNAEILAARAEAKADHLQLLGKVDRITKSHDRRLAALEEKTDSPNPDKH